MIDKGNLLNQLKINGIDQSHSFEEIDKVLSALKYTPGQRLEAYNHLKSVGWGNGSSAPSGLDLNAQEEDPEIRTSTVVPTTPKPAGKIEPSKIYDSGPQAPATGFASAYSKNKGEKSLYYSVGVIVLLLIVGAAYAFVEKLGPFGGGSYNESNIISGVLEKSSEIKSARYSLSGHLYMSPREDGAVPFTLKISNEAVLRQKYQNDYDRAEDASSILNLLRYDKSYPAGLSQLASSGSYRTLSLKDPKSGTPYSYALTNGGKNFALTVNFETSDAISGIRKSYGFNATSTIINGFQVTFTKDSSSYFYLSAEAPKPLFVTLAEFSRYLSADSDFSASIGAASDLENEQANWNATLDAAGSFGDLTYKVNIEAIRKDQNYFLRINKMPDLFFLSSISGLKGQWIKIPSASATLSTSTANRSDVNSEVAYFTKSISDAEKGYKENKKNFVDFLEKAASIADEENLFQFKSKPFQEKVDGRMLYHYELSVRKDAVIPFYKKLIAEVQNNSLLQKNKYIADQGFLDYLQSPEFDQTLDYYQKNTQLTLWTDNKGFPAAIQYTLRIIPPDTATALHDKEANLVFKLDLSDINTPVKIAEPENAKDIKSVVEDMNKNLYGYDQTSSQKSELSSIRSQAEIVYSENGYGGYGTVAFPAGKCQKTSGTLFSDSMLYNLIEKAAGGDASKATCATGAGSAGKISSYAVSVPLLDSPEYSWCVDNTGVSKQIVGAIKSSICR